MNKHQLIQLVYIDSASNDKALLAAHLSIGITELFSIAQMTLYLGLSLRKVLHHTNTIRDQFSALEHINLRWLRNLLLALSILYVIYIFEVFLSDLFGIDEAIDKTLYIMVVIVIYTMGYMGLRQPLIFSQPISKTLPNAIPVQQVLEQQVKPELKKYQRSALDENMSQMLFKELQQYMNTEKPYLDNNLTLTQLAGMLGFSPNYVSQIINEQSGNNFFDYINQYRIEALKPQLLEPAHAEANILTLALAAGFNSKSAFYSAFKKHTGMTPSQFRKQRNHNAN